MTDVFISYSHVDSLLADEICQCLDNEGISYFRDIKKVDWGDSINLEVRMALEKALAVIVIISPASLKSYWVPYEVGYALAFRRRILPYLTHPSLDVPAFIGDLKYVTTIEQVKQYFREKFADEKNDIQLPPTLLDGREELSLLRKAYNLMPDLLQEMKHDILSDKTRLVREFFILPSERNAINSPGGRFIYYESQHENLRNKVNLLEEYGFLIDVTPKSTPMYRMVDEFIDLLTSTDLSKTA